MHFPGVPLKEETLSVWVSEVTVMDIFPAKQSHPWGSSIPISDQVLQIAGLWWKLGAGQKGLWALLFSREGSVSKQTQKLGEHSLWGGAPIDRRAGQGT